MSDKEEVPQQPASHSTNESDPSKEVEMDEVPPVANGHRLTAAIGDNQSISEDGSQKEGIFSSSDELKERKKKKRDSAESNSKFEKPNLKTLFNRENGQPIEENAKKGRPPVPGKLYDDDVRQIIDVQYKLMRQTLKGEDIYANEVAMEFLDGYLCWTERNDPKKLDESIRRVNEAPMHCLLLFKTIYVICEQISHAGDRLSQIYHQELYKKEPYGRINDLVTEKLDDIATGNKSRKNYDKEAGSDIRQTYHRGLDELKTHQVNFDDIADVARINQNKPIKTFREPESVWSYIVTLRNYWSIIQFNGLMIFCIWWWLQPEDINLMMLAYFEGASMFVGLLLDLSSRIYVYRGSPYRLGFFGWPGWMVFFHWLIFVISFAYFPALIIIPMFSPSTFADDPPIVLIAIVCGVFVIRFIYNILLVLKFPYIAKGHLKQSRPPLGQRVKRGLLMLGYFLVTIAIMVILIRWFILPTLQNSSFWKVCTTQRDPLDSAYILCVMGTTSLWLPILATVLILNYIAHVLVLSIIGSVMAQSKGIGEFRGENYAVQTALSKLDRMVESTKEIYDAKIAHHGEKQRDDAGKTIKPQMFHFTMKKQDSFVYQTQKYNSATHIWWHIMYDLVETDMINEEQAWNSLFREKMYSIDLPNEPEKAIRFFLSSLSKIHTSEVTSVDLDRLPSLSMLIPTYSEALLFTENYLRNTTDKKISNIEFLAKKYKNEWKNFTERMAATYKIPNDPDWMLQNFLHPPKDATDKKFSKKLDEEVMFWASLRGQTVYRTIRGAHCYRTALELLFHDCLPDADFEALQKKVDEKLQIILAHQLFGDPAQHPNLARETKLMMKKFTHGCHKMCPLAECPLKKDRKCPIDLVFDWDSNKITSLEARRAKLEERRKTENISYYWESVLQQTNSSIEIGKKLASMINSPGQFSSVLAVYDETVKNSINPAMYKSVENIVTKTTAAKDDDDDDVLPFRIKHVIPRLNPLVLAVQGSLKFSPPEIIQGKASNQRNGLLFAWGTVVQTKDANQGGNLAEAVKFPIILQRFLWKAERPAIIGFRERVFTERQGTIARFQAYAEWSFVTITQRVLSLLGVRMHYGHPDFFYAPWVYSRAALSKASPRYNLSEDIFAGYMAFLHGKRSTHTDRIQDDKGRDVSISSTAVFTAKLAQGAASQLKTRDLFELNSRCDFITQFLLYQGTLGFYLSTTLMLSSVQLYVFALWLFSLARFSTENLGNLELAYSVPWLFQTGNFLLVPLLLESAIEAGVWKAFRVLIDVPLSMFFFLFQSQTTNYNFWQSFRFGFAQYMPTGRKLELSHKSLTELYQRFGRSHFFPGVDLFIYCIVYIVTTSSRQGGILPLFAPAITIIIFLAAPVLYDGMLTLKVFLRDIRGFVSWVYTKKSINKVKAEWKKRRQFEQFWKEHTGVINIPYNLLQTYNIFNAVESMLKTTSSVDVGLALYSLLKSFFWMLIVLSVPGQLRDVTVHVFLIGLIYVVWSFVLALLTTRKASRAANIVVWIIMLGVIVAYATIMKLYMFYDHLFIATFIVFKLFAALTWFVVYLKGAVAKNRANAAFKRLDAKKKKGKIDDATYKTNMTKTRDNLENSLIVTVYFGELIEKPYYSLSVTLILLPCHFLLGAFLHIPGLSDLLLYGMRLQDKRPPQVAGALGNPYQTPTPEGDNIEQFFDEDDIGDFGENSMTGSFV